MKRLATVLLAMAVAAVFTLAGCHKEKTPSQTGAHAGPTTQKAPSKATTKPGD